ncbi:MAG: hypothetical protein QJR04_25180 [Burkholderia multivorans]|nr:hypothetical protein [Burkholderia multivorans]
MSDEVQTATPETQPAAPAEAPQPAAPAAPVPPVVQAAAPAPAAPGDAPSPVPVAELNPGVAEAPVAELNPGVAEAPTVHETMLQRAHDELDRIIHRIAVGLDKGIDDLRALKASIASHLGL